MLSGNAGKAEAEFLGVQKNSSNKTTDSQASRDGLRLPYNLPLDLQERFLRSGEYVCEDISVTSKEQKLFKKD